MGFADLKTVFKNCFTSSCAKLEIPVRRPDYVVMNLLSLKRDGLLLRNSLTSDFDDFWKLLETIGNDIFRCWGSLDTRIEP